MFEGLFRPGHLLIVLAIALLVFGPSRLPQLGEALGKTIRDFKKAVNAVNEPPPKTQDEAPSKAQDEAPSKRLDDRGA